MPQIISNTPFCLIPEELFKEEQINEYWSVLCANPCLDYFGKDIFDDSVLIYPKTNVDESVHEITLMYNNLREKLPSSQNIIFLYVFETGFYLLTVKEKTIAFAGYFKFSVIEDILFHLANISHQYFEDISQVVFAYQQLPPPVLRLLNNYFEMVQIHE